MARIGWAEACQLDPSLQSLTRFFDVVPDYAQTLTGGLTNRCWKVVCPVKGAFVWRPITSITQAFSISRFQEYQILKAIEKENIAPQAAFINDQGLLVAWRDGHSLEQDADFDTVLKCLSRIHLLDKQRIPIAPFNYTARVDHYWLQLRDELKDEALESLYQTWRLPPAVDLNRTCLCHFDLGGYNLVKNDDSIQIIDWEYAGIADPCLDLALSIVAADENLPASVARYCQLMNIMEVDEWIDGVKSWLPRTEVMGLLWYLLAYQLRGEEYYLEQATQLKQSLCN